uniref:alanine racemase n=1 Tax=Anaerococcus mediterraneensis TaxID=1870984 RepID=UPI00093008F9|nr:alanine racemase [Anaerococcus mediterraneensis]
MQETYLEVNIDKIRKNIIKLKSLDPNSLFCAVVKANAYGLGVVEISKNIEDLVDYFAVARASEAFILRKNKIKKPILVLGYIDLNDIKKCSELDIDIPIYDLEYAKSIDDLGYQLKCHLALDTGHSRLGFRRFEIDKIRELKDLNNLDIISAFSHFSTADEKDTSYTQKQLNIFDEIISAINNDFDFKFLHISNSAGLIKHKISKGMIRAGISIYGLYPSDVLKNEEDVVLERSFRLFSTVSFVKDIDKDTPVSYGRTFISHKKMKVATVTIGYADGFLRSFSNVGDVYINGHNCKILGRICMDQIIVDVSDIDVKIGDRVEIYRDIYRQAKNAGTITYELMTNISLRVTRSYILDNHLFKTINYLGEIYES